jgi:hypothetical protein
MHFGKLISRILPAGMLLLYCLQPFAQRAPSSAGGGGAEGRLTVTATVVSSVGLVVGPDGEQKWWWPMPLIRATTFHDCSQW